VTCWTQAQDRWELGELLQANGVAAAPVEHVDDTIERDPHLMRHFQALRQPSEPDAEILVDGEAIRFAGVERTLRRSPAMGEHSRDVLQHLLGIDDERFIELMVGEVIN